MKLSKDELKVFREQEEKKQAILHDLGLLATQSLYALAQENDSYY